MQILFVKKTSDSIAQYKLSCDEHSKQKGYLLIGTIKQNKNKNNNKRTIETKQATEKMQIFVSIDSLCVSVMSQNTVRNCISRPPRPHMLVPRGDGERASLSFGEKTVKLKINYFTKTRYYLQKTLLFALVLRFSLSCNP